jgi:hypothetical protein
MRTIRNITILMGLSLALLALAATEATGQVIDSARFAGTFTLPTEAQWGTTTLPAGNYTFRYGILHTGAGLVEVRGTAKGGHYSMIVAGPGSQTSTTNNAILCTREGNRGYVRELQMGAIGETVRFILPHRVRVRAWLVAGKRNASPNNKLDEVRIPITRGPVSR